MTGVSLRGTGAALAALSLLAAVSAAEAQNATPMRIRGTVASIDGQDLTVKSRDGATVPIKLAPDYTVTAVVKAAMSDIVVGKYVGIAAVPQGDDAEKALEVLVFPEAARGSGEGHYAWDLAPGSMMINVTIAEAVDKVDGRTLTLKHKDGVTQIAVPQDVPVVTFAPGDRSLLVADAGVMVPAAKQPDGTFTASRILVGKDGVKPPM
jgi:outer membrane lipoprotein SlyB